MKYKVVGMGGSGYLATGSSGKTFGDAVRTNVTPGTDVVVVFGSLNDQSRGASVGDEASEVYGYIEETAPGAQLVVVGPPVPYDDPSDEDTVIAEAVQDAADGNADAYVDPIAGDWFDDKSIIGGDGVHPTDEGHDLMADKLAPVLQDAIEATQR